MYVFSGGNKQRLHARATASVTTAGVNKSFIEESFSASESYTHPNATHDTDSDPRLLIALHEQVYILVHNVNTFARRDLKRQLFIFITPMIRADPRGSRLSVRLFISSVQFCN